MMQPPQPSPPPKQDNQREKSAVPVSVFVGVVLVVALIIVCGLGAVGMIPSLRGLKNPTATAIPTQSAAHAAKLGGTVRDFVERYGNSIDESGLMYAATLTGQRVLIVVALDDPRQSRDGRSHGVALDVQVPGDALGAETWSADTAGAIAQVYLPADAQFQRTVVLNGVGGDVAYHIYHSDEMTATFMPGAYTNVAGALSYSCHAWPPTQMAAMSAMAAGSNSGYAQCHIGVGSA